MGPAVRGLHRRDPGLGGGAAATTRTGRDLTHRQRLSIAVIVIVICMFLASRFGLVALIATGYRALAYILLATFILPLVTVGIWKLWRSEISREPQTPPVQE